MCVSLSYTHTHTHTHGRTYTTHTHTHTTHTQSYVLCCLWCDQDTGTYIYAEKLLIYSHQGWNHVKINILTQMTRWPRLWPSLYNFWFMAISHLLATILQYLRNGSKLFQRLLHCYYKQLYLLPWLTKDTYLEAMAWLPFMVWPQLLQHTITSNRSFRNVELIVANRLWKVDFALLRTSVLE